MQQPGYVENVPPEIWAKIIRCAQKESRIEDTYDQTRSTRCDVPISASQVCGRLRQITVNTPYLWTSIVVNFATEKSSYVSSLTRLWLERSKGLPLSLFIYHIHGRTIEQNQEQRECLASLLSHIGRWREAALELVNADDQFWSSNQGTFFAPLLESLVLRASVYDEVTKGILPYTLWDNSPRLRKFVVVLDVIQQEDDTDLFRPDDDGYSTWATSHAIPYKQLTHLRLGASHEIISREEILAIFTAASNLVCCFISGIAGPEPAVASFPPPIPLNDLVHLYLKPASVDDTDFDFSMSEILSYITAPSLVSLTLVSQRSWDFDMYRNFIRRSSCALQELNIIGVFPTLKQLRACLELTSGSLCRLHVDRLYDQEFSSDMTSWDTVNNEYKLCPSLEQISLAYPTRYARDQYTFHLTTQVLQSRLRPPVGGSKRFKTLLIPSRDYSRLLPELHTLCEDPMGLTIGFNDGTLKMESRWERVAYQ